jgi:hypothetical protein
MNILVVFKFIKTGKVAPVIIPENDNKEYRDGGFVANLVDYQKANKSSLPWDTIMDKLKNNETWSGSESFGTRLYISPA